MDNLIVNIFMVVGFLITIPIYVYILIGVICDAFFNSRLRFIHKVTSNKRR